MADEPDKSEQTEAATPFKLQDAREKGSVAKSMEVNSFMVMLAGLIFLLAAGKSFVDGTLALCARIFRSAGKLDFDLPQLLKTGSDWGIGGIEILAPLVSLIVIVGILSTFVQIGPVFSFFPIKPDIQRINPVAGFKRLFSIKLLYEALKSIVKLGLFGAVLWFTLTDMVKPLLGLYSRDHSRYVDFFNDLSASLIFRMLLVAAVIAAADLLYTRWEFQKKMRMSRKELKDEYKRREGDPAIRQKRKALERELRKRSETLGNVPEADLVITNPTRFAVVLKYDRSTMIAPVLTGKGTGEMARLIREKAYQHKVPVINSPELARRLFKTCQMNAAIAQDNYVAVARVFRQVYRMREERGAVA
jgi:flagellar biosynthesis protein FlhB